MLVQKQTPERLKKILLFGGIPIVLLAGYVLYLNLSGGGDSKTTSTTTQTKTVSKDFGQAIFRDARFYSLSPKTGTDLISQATATVPATELPAPAVEVFDVQTGSTILFTWKVPANLDANIVRVSRVVGESTENLVTLPATATSFLYTKATDKQESSYTVNFVKQLGVVQSAQVVSKAGTTNGGLTVVAADNAGVKLQWAIPAGNEGKRVEIYRSESVGTLGKRVGSVEAGATTYEDLGGRADLHFYTVIWVGEVTGGVPWTGKITSTDIAAPEAPDFVTTTYDSTQKVVRISWAPSQSSDVFRYDVYRSEESLLLGELVGERLVEDIASVDQATSGANCSQELCIEDKKLTPGKSIYYTVVAVDNAGNQSSTQELTKAGRANPFLPL